MADSAKFIKNAAGIRIEHIKSGRDLAHFCGVSTAKMQSVRTDKTLGFPDPVLMIGKGFCAVYDKAQVAQWLKDNDIVNTIPDCAGNKRRKDKRNMAIKTLDSLDKPLALSFLAMTPLSMTPLSSMGETYE